VGGDVRIGAARPAYRLTEVTGEPAELTVEAARNRPTRLLQPRYQVVPFTGREREQDDLGAWLGDAADPIAVRLVHAAGGQGKTRLAARVAAGCRAGGWAVWQAHHQPAGAAPTPTAERLSLPDAGILLIVDYADRWPAADLVALVGGLQQLAKLRSAPVRVLLLGRTAKGWWPAIVGLLDARHAIDATTNSALAPLGDRHARFEEAAARFTERLGAGPAAVEPPADLDRDEYAPVLAVHMAALSAVDSRLRGNRAPTDLVAVSDYLLCREYAAWTELHDHRTDFTRAPVMTRLTYLATLCGSQPRPRARVALRRSELADSAPAADKLLDHHLACYPSPDADRVFEPLHPDRLGEDLVALTTPGHPYPSMNWQPDDWVTAAAVTDDDRVLSAAESLVGGAAEATRPWSPTVLAVLAETAHRWTHVAGSVVNPLLRANPHLLLTACGPVATRLVEIPGLDTAVLESAEALLPDERNVNIDLAAAAIAERLTGIRLAATTDPVERARLHGRLAVRLDQAGRRTEALGHLQTAVDLCRQAGATAELARWASALSLQLSAAGRRTEALDLAREAVDLRRAGDPADQAEALTNLGKAYAELGRHREGLPRSEEASRLYRQLAEADPHTYLPDLALSLHNVAAARSDTHRRTEALAAARESADIYRKLADADADRHLPDLADALTNLQVYLSDTDDTDAAIETGEEAVRVLRRLADVNRAAFAGTLAGALYNLSVTRSRAGLLERAVEAGQEAADRYTELAEADPGAHLADRALARNNLGKLLGESGRFTAARSEAVLAVADYRTLAAIEAEAFEPDLAMALYNLAAADLQAGDGPAAVRSATEAVTIYRRLAEGDPDEHRDGLADALHNLGVICGETGDWRRGLPHIEEAVRRYRGLREDDPDGWTASWAIALSSQAQALHELGRDADSLPLALDAEKAARGLAADPQVLAGVLNNLALCLAGAGHREQARDAARESVRRYRELQAEFPDVYGPLLAVAEQTLRDVG
jgi:tetratricopeptide (TPR) repeat protein